MDTWVSHLFGRSSTQLPSQSFGQLKFSTGNNVLFKITNVWPTYQTQKQVNKQQIV